MIKFLGRLDPLVIFIAPLLLLTGSVIKVSLGIEPLAFTYWMNLGISPGISPWVNYAISTFLALLTSFLINQMLQNAGILGKISNITMLVFVLLYFSVPDLSNFWLYWPLVLLQLLVLNTVLEIYDQPTRASRLAFNASFIIGCLALVFPNAMLLMIIVFQSQILANTAKLRSIIIALVGCLLPLYLLNSVAFILDNPFVWPKFSHTFSLLHGPFLKYDTLGIIFLGFMGLIAALSLSFFSSSVTLRERRRWHIIVGYLVVAFWMMLQEGYPNAIFVAIIPSCIVISKVLLSIKNQKLASAALLLFIAFVLSINS